MKIMVLTVLMMSSSLAFSQTYDVEAIAAGRWMCEAEGRLMTGGPGGGMWQRVRAYGDDELDAASNALNRCFSQGLRECRVGYCGRMR